jgi:hypothetical protein
MPRFPRSSKTLDLFDYSPPTTASTPKLVTAKVRQPSLPELSNRALLALLQDLVRELEHRVGAEAGPMRHEFEHGILDALSRLEKLSPKPQRRRAPPTAATKSPLHPAKQKAVRAALAAGVAPGQVAKHFGLSLAEVRKALAEPE